VAEASTVNFTVEAADDTSSETFYLQTLLIALALMDARGEFDSYERTVEELQLLPTLLLEAKASWHDAARDIADRIAADDYHIITGAGASWPEAFYYGTCILEEMQWIRTRPIHSSDFFHGTLELVEKGVSVILLRGEDSLRPLVDRVERFAHQYTDKVVVLDSADVELPGVSADVRALVSQVVLATVLERVSAHLEVLRAHPLTTRRYYRRVDY
jgi:fructoselysine-6-phosphate deglycase